MKRLINEENKEAEEEEKVRDATHDVKRLRDKERMKERRYVNNLTNIISYSHLTHIRNALHI
jgi:hypothetical protein